MTGNSEGSEDVRETLEELRRFVDETFPASTCNPRLHAIAGAATRRGAERKKKTGSVPNAVRR